MSKMVNVLIKVIITNRASLKESHGSFQNNVEHLVVQIASSKRCEHGVSQGLDTRDNHYAGN